MAETQFDRVVRQTLQVLEQKDWNALQSISCPQVIFMHISRVFPAQYSSATWSHLVPPQYLNSMKSQRPDTAGHSSSEVTVVTSVSVDATRPLQTGDKNLFVDFCGLVHDSLAEGKYRRLRIAKGTYLRANDGFTLVGPAVQGVISSDRNWRVEFLRMEQGWRVCRLIVTEHG